MLISVTEHDIKEGVRTKCRACPIALAIKRATGNSDVSVGYYDFFIGDDMYFTTKEMMQFIKDFDMGLFVQPTQFQIGVKSE